MSTKYIAISNHACSNVYYFFSIKWFDSLPDDLKTLVTDLAADAAKKQAELDDADNATAMDTMKQAGVQFAELADIDQWKASMNDLKAANIAKGASYAALMDLIEKGKAEYDAQK